MGKTGKSRIKLAKKSKDISKSIFNSFDNSCIDPLDDDIYTKQGLDNCFEEGLISTAEEGFMLGYLMA